MSSVDISTLGQLTPSQPLDLTKYAAPTAKTEKPKFVMPPAGVYELQLPVFTTEHFSKSQAGALKVRFDATIASGPFAGSTVRFITLSAKTYERDGVEQSMLGNLVAAAGGDTFPGVGEDGDPTPQVRAVEAIGGRTVKAYLNWEANDRKFGSGIEVKGMNKFPQATTKEGTPIAGQYQPYFELADQLNERGYPQRVWANLYVSNFELPTR